MFVVFCQKRSVLGTILEVIVVPFWLFWESGPPSEPQGAPPMQFTAPLPAQSRIMGSLRDSRIARFRLKTRKIEVRKRSPQQKHDKREKKESKGPSKTELSIERGFEIRKIRSIENRLRFGAILATFLEAKVSTIQLLGGFFFDGFWRSQI